MALAMSDSSPSSSSQAPPNVENEAFRKALKEGAYAEAFEYLNRNSMVSVSLPEAVQLLNNLEKVIITRTVYETIHIPAQLMCKLKYMTITNTYMHKYIHTHRSYVQKS